MLINSQCVLVLCFRLNNNECALLLLMLLLQSTAACAEAQSDAIQPAHIREAIRRYGHKIGPLSPYTVCNKKDLRSYIYNLREV